MMRWLVVIRLRFRSLFRARDVETDLARELRGHVEAEIDANLQAGMAPADARRAAIRSFGPIAPVEEACRDTRRVALLEHLARDGRYAWRTLGREPGLLVAATTSIALGVGANLLIFALANSLLLSVPTADRPGDLVNIRTGNGSHVSYRGWQQLNDSGALDAIAGYQFEQSINLRDGDGSRTLVPLLVTANFFDVLRAPFALGRGFTAAEARAELEPRLVVVSHGFWQQHLQGDPGAVGRTLAVNGESYTITGVLPSGWHCIAGYGLAPEVYLPLSRSLVPGLLRPRSAAAQLFGRLRPGQTVAQGRAALSAVAARVGAADDDPEFRDIREFDTVGGLAQVREMKEVGAFFLVLAIVSGLVLAIACANVAGLLLARSLARRREIALRLALGASRARLVQQLLVESLALAVAGSALGAVLTALAFIAISSVSLPLPLPVELRFALDGRTVGLAMALVVLSATLTGLAPALQATRTALTPALKRGERDVMVRRVTARGLLVTGQVAVSVLLLVAALLFVRNLSRATAVDLGFDADRVLVAQVSFVEGRQGQRGHLALEDLADRVGGVPGVEAAAAAEGVPLTIFSGAHTETLMTIDGHDARAAFDSNSVGPGYFATMGIRLVRGRDFSRADGPGAPRVIVIDEEFARRYFGGVDPIGRHVSYAGHQESDAEVIGVVTNSKYRSVAEGQDAAVFEPLLQADTPRRLGHLLVRAAGAGESMAAGVRKAVLAADPSAAVTVTPMTAALAFALMPSQLGSATLGLLGALGTVLAMVGLFGVVSFTVSRRTTEFAIRIALGASRSAVMRLVMRDAARLVGAGLGAGLALAWLVTGPLAAFLVAGLSPTDPFSYSGASILLVAASLAAVWGPVRRAVRLSPGQILKHDRRAGVGPPHERLHLTSRGIARRKPTREDGGRSCE